ncbi:sugar transferase [Aequorivita marina]|uniref:sugar transferase n=1 Tax=Aequorivita marina TaxID=3073654 RepID=UPI0028763C03|nr:sugar transferase [Aequorivita sp. S2608]MDS1299050.1 sugar transferase [Aequorivita sp. S2608]
MYRNGLKRCIDFLASFIGFILISPIILIIAIALAFQNRGTPFFLQTRPGKNQKAFKIIKFKTMTDQRDVNGDLLPDNYRVTSLGRVIRKLSIDELPQLINVLKGDMSLVGPRPLLFKYIPLFSPEQLRRHEVRPGITGWAQVNGRNSISWTRKFQLDVEYIDKLSMMLDLKILYLTILKVIIKEGVNQEKDSPMQPFNGKN